MARRSPYQWKEVMMSEPWEYMTYDMTKRNNSIEDLNQLGRAGWEAVAMVSSWGIGWRFVHPIVLLKRPVSHGN